ncbi:myocardial zonula adherens protein isoform X2 [Thalassophryne amazonica]|uniref:myocardial zonula adherens protein isoform X2 n=1 Tax=Thalassophryne amazonica TaxID=390379 RepID=UPI001470E3BA|nr:myocardial zonula adherens protein isoform X2 [Thalassophryne amazonica]
MLRYGPARIVSTTTTEDSVGSSSERTIRRLRLTLHAGENGHKEPKHTISDTADKEKDVSGAWRKKNGLIQRERPAGRESPQQLGDLANGALETSLQHHGSKVYGIVQRTGSDRQQEVMAREWTVSHLHDEMRYIREVRDSLEKVRERMYGQFGGMQQSMQKLSQEIGAANSHRRSLENEVKIRTAAMESFDQMNSSLMSANISLQLPLQKSLLENCQSRVDMREEMKSLKSTYQKAQEQLRDKERQLAEAQATNQTLRLQVEASQEASSQALQELSARLHREYEQKLLEEQQRHREEIENLQAQLDRYIRRLEEAEKNIQSAEAKITERDQRISELERLLDCMGKEKSQLEKKLQECEKCLRLLQLADTTDGTTAKRSKQLEGEASDLRERIKHLNDMVFCQQRKVKGMIEEVESLRAQVAQKDMFISELLDRIAIVECENNEIEDKLKYFMSTQNKTRDVETREIGVGCDLLPSEDVTSPVQNQLPTLRPTLINSSFYLTSPTQPRTFKPGNPPPSRLESSLLKYTPLEYTRYLQSKASASSEASSPTESEPLSPVQSDTDEVDAKTSTEMDSIPEELTASSSASEGSSSPSQIYTPFMRLMDMTAKLTLDS